MLDLLSLLFVTWFLSCGRCLLYVNVVSKIKGHSFFAIRKHTASLENAVTNLDQIVQVLITLRVCDHAEDDLTHNAMYSLVSTGCRLRRCLAYGQCVKRHVHSHLGTSGWQRR